MNQASRELKSANMPKKEAQKTFTCGRIYH